MNARFFLPSSFLDTLFFPGCHFSNPDPGPKLIDNFSPTAHTPCAHVSFGVRKASTDLILSLA